MLTKYFYSTMQRKRFHYKMILQKGGASAHSCKEVRRWLNENFNGRWIDGGGSISWAVHSPDLAPLDFFLWERGYIKMKVYKTKASDIVDLKERMEQEMKAVKRDIGKCC